MDYTNLNNILKAIVTSASRRNYGRLNPKEAADILGFQEHDIPILINAKLLKPLGKPRPNATKYFAACEIEQLAGDKEWLGKATQAIYDHWTGKTERKTSFKSRIPANQTNQCQSLETAMAA